MKTDEQALKEWTLNEIHFDPGKKKIIVFTRQEFTYLCRAIRERDDFLVIREGKTPMQKGAGAALGLPNIVTSKQVLHWGLVDRLMKVPPFMTHLNHISQPEWSIKFESLLEMVEWFEADARKTGEQAVKNGRLNP